MSRIPLVPRVVLPAVFAALTALLLTGCPQGGGASAGKAPGVLRYPITADPTTWDPALVQDGPTIDLLQNIHQGLVGWDEKSQVVPLIAARMPEISADGKTYTFTIRDGARFSNGRAITAEDVRYSLARSLDRRLNSSVAMNYLNDIVGAAELAQGRASELAGVKALDAKTVQIALVAPRGYFLGKLTYPTAYIVPKEEVEKGAKNPQGVPEISDKNTVGCGPFVLKEFVPHSKAILAASETYWGGRPKLNRIERPIVKDAKTARNLYDAGQLDIVTLEKSNYEQDRDNPALKDQIKLWDRAATFYLGINQTHIVPFRDKRVRQAIAHAIDKDAIVNNVLLGVNLKAEGVLPKGIPGFDETLRGPAHDVEQAKKLLADAGFPGGKGLPAITLSFREQQPDLRKTAEVLKEQLAAVGINVNLTEMEWGAYLKMNNDNKHDLFHMRWAADYIDPQNFLSLLLMSDGPENHTGYKNPAYDALCRQADAEKDLARRIALYRKAEAMVVDDAPWVPIYFQRDLELVKPWVHGIRDSLLGHLPHTGVTIE